MGRSPCCEKEAGLKKGPWTPEEDQKLLAHVEQHGHGCWRSLPTKAGLRRCGKSCRLRWTNYLRPDIKRGKFTVHEEQTIIQLHALLGNRWSSIATHLARRTDNEIKNYWNTHLKKRLAKMGIDPVTHKPRTDDAGSRSRVLAAHLSHTAQWESARLEAEARLARDAKLRSLALSSQTSSVLDSPTSTLSFFSDSAMFPVAATDMHGPTVQPPLQPTYDHQHQLYGGGEPGLTGVLLDCSVAVSTDHTHVVVEMGDAGVSEEEEDDKGYWSSILNMVNSSVSSEAVTDPVIFSPATATAGDF